MAQILLRLEKPMEAAGTVPKHTAYFEFHLLSGNRVQRLWAIYKNGRPQSMKEAENFQSTEALKGYVQSMREFYEKQGFKVVSGEWAAQPKGSKSSKAKTPPAPPAKPPVISKTAGMGELPPGVAGVLTPDALTK